LPMNILELMQEFINNMLELLIWTQENTKRLII
jgi:hypothetical protein